MSISGTRPLGMGCAMSARAREVGGGRIVTFYSYKGGTGRTMTLANIAWILAAAGRRLLDEMRR